jgi:hypothetical protein
MLVAEAALLHELQIAALRALDMLTRAGQHERDPRRARLLALVALRSAADKLRHEVTIAVAAGRGAGRDAAAAQLADELDAAATTLKLTAIAIPGPRDRADDEHRAAAAADSYVAAWRAGALVAITRWTATADRPALATALTAAHEQQDHRLRRIAATEVPQAYSEEHAGRADALAEQHRGKAWLVLLVKVWDSTLDRKICPICADMDRRWAIVGRPFKGGLLPGAVHPFCRCLDSLLALKPGVMIPGAAYVGATAAA